MIYKSQCVYFMFNKNVFTGSCICVGVGAEVEG